MNRKHSSFYQTLFTGTLAALFLGAIGYPFNAAQAQGRPLGAPPGNHRSGAARGACFAADRVRGLTALMDDSDPALTTQANPTLLFYLPFGQAPFSSADGQSYNATSAEFELRDVNENSALKNQKIVVSIPNKPGIVKLALPKTETALEPDKEYFWSLRIICDPNDNTANPSVSGWIKRVKSDASGNAWLDRLDQLAQSPTNQLDKWTELLKPFNLQEFSQATIIELKPADELRTGAEAGK
jgi:hypothetical protein